MKKEEIHLDDIRRILFGEAPPEFLLEVFVRAIIMYVALVIVVRLLGKRTNAQLTITEKAVFITLGAIVALPMQGPTSGIVVGIVILICVLFFQRTLTRTYFKSPRWESMIQGKMRMLVKDSVIDIGALKNVMISRQQLFEILRNKGIRQLGQVKRVYLEASGTFSIYHYEDVKPGLSIMPDKDKIINTSSEKVCAKCGNAMNKNLSDGQICGNCDNTEWVNASKEFIQ